jgi:hypothetical protein
MTDKELALELIDNFHRESGDLLYELFERHNDEQSMTEVENIIMELHSQVHIARNRLMYERDTVYVEELQ